MQRNEGNTVIQREKETLSKMISLYCRLKHRQKDPLCEDCDDLKQYALARLDNCPWGEDKPNCKRCTIHCYRTDYRERIRQVMHFSGPRMLIYHPIETLFHYLRR